MPRDVVTRFVSECTQKKRLDDARAIEVGPTVWLLGSPAPATDGMVGLATTPTQTIYFRKTDILDAKETENRFLINLASNTNLLIREERVVKLNATSCKCHGQGKMESRVGSSGGTHGSGGPIVIDCTPVCDFEMECGPYKEPKSGAVIIVCWWKFVCRDPCETIPA